MRKYEENTPSKNSAKNNVVALPPTENLFRSLTVNHSLKTGLDELIDNAIDARAKNIALVFHFEGHHITSIRVHDDGSGMKKADLYQALRLGAHISNSDNTIGIYGVGMKEGSLSNAREFDVCTRSAGQRVSGLRLYENASEALILDEKELTSVWNERSQIGPMDLGQGTSIVWSKLRKNYTGESSNEGAKFIQTVMDEVRRHISVRYHRYLRGYEVNEMTENPRCPGNIKRARLADQSNPRASVSIRIYACWDDDPPCKTAQPIAIDPFNYKKSGLKGYPRRLTVNGNVNATGITVHIWPNYSKSESFTLESKDPMGHQGFYVYSGDRLITHGGWFSFANLSGVKKLLRIEIDDPELAKRYMSISPQKASVQLTPEFTTFMASLRDPENIEVDWNYVLKDAERAVKMSNIKAQDCTPLPEPGRGLSPVLREAIWEGDRIKGGDAVDIYWGKITGEDFIALDSNNGVVLNAEYRQMFVGGRGSKYDAPVLRTLVWLVFGDIASAGRLSQKKSSDLNRLIRILNVALKEQIRLGGRD